MAPPTVRSLKVLHVLTSNQRRGAESFGVTLQRNLLARGHRARAVALFRASQPPRLDVAALGNRSLDVLTLARLRRQVGTADVIIAHGSRTLPACALALAGVRVPVVYVNIGDPLFWADSRLRRERVRWMLRRVRAVAARTESSRAALVDSLGMPAADVRVIGNGRHAEDFPPADDAARSAARRALGLDPDGDVVVYLGALSPEKRVDVAVDAVALLPPTTRLLLAGDGPLREQLETRGREMLGQRAIFLGPRGDAARVLAAADVLVLPSDSEGLPGVVIEAGFVGLPVVATNVGFVPDVVVDGVTGMLVPPGVPEETAIALAKALDRRAEMGAAGRRHCLARFEMSHVVDAWERLLDEVTR